MQQVNEVSGGGVYIENSQFPLWDFFECNMNRPGMKGSYYVWKSLNSLCGISSNATGEGVREQWR